MITDYKNILHTQIIEILFLILLYQSDIREKH